MDQSAASVQIVDGIDPEDAFNLMTPKNPPGVVRVRGQVDSLQPWWSKSKSKAERPDCYFGTLSSLSSAACIDFKCTGHAAPDVGQLVVLEGALTYAGRGNQSGLKILLSGNYVGTFTIPDAVEMPLRPQDRAPKKTLIDYLEQKHGDLSGLLIIGSERGVADIRSSLGEHAAQVHFETVMLTNFIRVMEIINGASGDAVILVRSDDEVPLSFCNRGDCVRQLLASGKYFYTALGHSQRVTLVDLFADQPFQTPQYCGQAIAAVIGELKIKKELRSALQNKANEVTGLHEARENDQLWNDRKIASQMYEFSLLKRKLDSELAILSKEKRLANLWVKLFGLVSLVLFSVLLAFIFNAGGVRSFLLRI